MNVGSIFFAVCAAMCVFGALATIVANNPIRGAMGLLTTIVGIAGLFIRLSAEFLAAMQLLVYAGAVVVLFVFVVMLLGPTANLSEKSTGSAVASRIISGALIALVGVGALALFTSGDFHNFEVVAAGHGTVEAVGALIFSGGLVPFEVTTVLLIVAVVGAIAVARTNPSKVKKVESDNPTLRMYHGPLMDRDAERPLNGETLAERVLGKSTKGPAS